MNFKLQTRSSAECPTPHAFHSPRHDKWFQGGFTLVELLIVITILAVLSGVALLDYGFSVKKAHIQVAAEELVALLGDASVRSQTQFSQIDIGKDGKEISTVVCYGVTIEKGQSPVLFKTIRDEETKTCLISTDPLERESVQTLSWDNLVFVKTIDWVAFSADAEKTSGSEDWIAFLFSPPKGEISMYLKSDSLVEKKDVTEVQVDVAYQNSSEPVLNKIIKVSPVTSSFMILPGTEAL